MLTNFFNRIALAVKAFNKPNVMCIEIGNGVILDLSNNRLVIPGDFEFHAEGNLRLTSDRHIILKSGQDADRREGYTHSIWLNSEEDENGDPLFSGRIDIEAIEDGSDKHSK